MTEFCKHGVPKGVCRLGEKDCELPSVAELNNEYLRDTYVKGLSSSSWQGLSDAEKKGMWLDTDNISWPAFKETYLLIEQALKEKNT